MGYDERYIKQSDYLKYAVRLVIKLIECEGKSKTTISSNSFHFKL